MVSSVQAKVSRLEAATGGGGLPPCDTCGWGDGEEPFGHGHGDTYELVFEDAMPGESPGENEYCPECGRLITLTLKWPENLS